MDVNTGKRGIGMFVGGATAHKHPEILSSRTAVKGKEV
jgi:hypothetical protein